jgi:hypothetical protein
MSDASSTACRRILRHAAEYLRRRHFSDLDSWKTHEDFRAAYFFDLCQMFPVEDVAQFTSYWRKGQVGYLDPAHRIAEELA